jgi:hypothetical protein
MKIGENEGERIEISFLSKRGFSTQRRKGRRGANFLFGGEKPPNKKASITPGWED